MNKLGTKALRGMAACALACSLCAGAAAPAAAATRTHEVTFVAASADGSAAFSGEAFSIWKVADEAGAPTEAFAGVERGADEAAYASSLAEAAAGVEPDAEFTTGADGTAALPLERGTYLVAGSDAISGGVTYSAVPYVMDLADRTLAENLTSYVKYASDGPAPAAPETGGAKKAADGGNAKGTGLAVTGDMAVGAALAAAAATAAASAAVAARKQMDAEGKENA